MLVICCGMPRAASTLQYQIVCELIVRAGRGKRPTEVPPPMTPEMTAGPDPIHVAKTHLPDPAIESRLNHKFTRYVYIYRDVRDAISSLILKDGDLEDDDIARQVQQRMITPFYHFTARHNVLVSRYETVIQSIPGEIRRIARFIGIDIDPARAEAIAYTVDLKTQRRYLEDRDWPEGQTVDPRTLLHKNHIHDAKPGKFRGVLTPAQLNEVERIARPWLTSRGYALAQDE